LFYLFIHFACSFHSGYHTFDGFFVIVAPGYFSGVWIWLAMAVVDLAALAFLAKFYLYFVHQFEQNVLDAYGEPVVNRDDSSILRQIKQEQRAFAIARRSSEYVQNEQLVSEEEWLQRQLDLRPAAHLSSPSLEDPPIVTDHFAGPSGPL
jgi:hypothetical protein